MTTSTLKYLVSGLFDAFILGEKVIYLTYQVGFYLYQYKVRDKKMSNIKFTYGMEIQTDIEYMVTIKSYSL